MYGVTSAGSLLFTAPLTQQRAAVLCLPFTCSPSPSYFIAWFLSPLMAYFLCPGVNHINWKSSVLHWILLKGYVYKLCSNLKQIKIQHWHVKTTRQLHERAKCSTVKGVTFERAHGSTGQSVGFRHASCVTSQVRDPFYPILFIFYSKVLSTNPLDRPLPHGDGQNKQF